MEPKVRAPGRRRWTHLQGRAMEKQGQQLHEVAQLRAVSLLNPEDVGQRKRLFPVDASIALCGLRKESKLRKVFDHNSSLKKGRRERSLRLT